MEFLIMFIAAISSIIAIICSNLYTEFRIKKELFKSNVALKICYGSGLIAMISILIVAVAF